MTAEENTPPSKNDESVGALRLQIASRLIENWKDLLIYFNVPPLTQDRLKQQNDPDCIWRWLEANSQLAELPKALEAIGREDLVPVAEKAVKLAANRAASRTGLLITLLLAGALVAALAFVLIVIIPGDQPPPPGPCAEPSIEVRYVTGGPKGMSVVRVSFPDQDGTDYDDLRLQIGTVESFQPPVERDELFGAQGLAWQRGQSVDLVVAPLPAGLHYARIVGKCKDGRRIEGPARSFTAKAPGSKG